VRFNDQVALVTGGGRGVGAACVRRFSEDGASVLIADMDERAANEVAAEITQAGGHALR
jgi:NAD(P)-dependent dehydrogenase (short-subunit alcohol dehydrogenase family)